MATADWGVTWETQTFTSTDLTEGDGRKPDNNRNDENVAWTEAAYSTIGIVGTIGNLMVIIVIFNYTKLREKMTNIFIINQSVMDLLASVLLVAHAQAKAQRILLPGISSWFMCNIWYSSVFLFSFFMSSTYNLVATNLERYMAVVYPIFHKIYFTRRKAIVAIAMVWLIGPLYNFPLTVPTTAIVNGTCLGMMKWPSHIVRSITGVITFLVEFLIPILIIICSYFHMVVVLRRKSTSVGVTVDNTSSNPGQQSRQAKLAKIQRNLLKTLATVSMAFILCWTCNQVSFLQFNLGLPSPGGGYYHFTVISAFLNCCVNPIIYVAQYKEFQKGLKALLPCIFGKEQVRTSENTTNITMSS